MKLDSVLKPLNSYFLIFLYIFYRRRSSTVGSVDSGGSEMNGTASGHAHKTQYRSV